jgi:ABC-type lipoprotein export system ATPase subunit
VPTAGTVNVDAENLSTLDDDRLTLLLRHKIGFIFQACNL